MTAAVKYLLPLLSPLGLGILLLIAALVLLVRRPWHLSGRILAGLSLLVLLLGSLPLLSSHLLRGLEYQHPPAAVEDLNAAGIRTVVVLGGGVLLTGSRPITSVLSAPSLIRLIEGIRLHQGLEAEDARLLLSGRGPMERSEAAIMGDLAIEIGVPESAIDLEEDSMNTADQARNLKRLLGDERFVLVTDAAHMPRSLKAFRLLGMDPIPAPTAHVSYPRSGGLGSLLALPHSSNLQNAERLLYETLGDLRTQRELKKNPEFPAAPIRPDPAPAAPAPAVPEAAR